MTSERLGEMFKGDSADTCAGKFPLVSMGGRTNPSSVRRRGARTPIGASGINTTINNSINQADQKMSNIRAGNRRQRGLDIIYVLR